MATTRNDALKEGTLDGAADRLAAQRAERQAEGFVQPPPPQTFNIFDETPDALGGVPEEATEELEAEPVEAPVEEPVEETPEEVAPADADDLFADDDLDEAVETQTLEAPSALSKEGKELFSELAPELQREVEARIKAAERGASQKVQQVSQKEKEVDQMAQQVLQMREEWSNKLGSLDVQLPELPRDELSDENSEHYDPDTFNRMMARYERAKLTVEKQRAEHQKLAEEQSRTQAQRQQEELRLHAEGIVKTFPSWSTQEKFTQGVSSVQDFIASEIGVSVEEARKITNPAFIKIAYMAKQYKQAKEKVRGKRAPSKASAPTGRSRTTQTTSLAKARESLKETGSLNDAAAILSATRKRK